MRVMNTNPLVSILIPNFNKIAYIEDMLESIRIQTYLNWECIIVDDHSDDGGFEVLQEFEKKDARFRVFRRPSYFSKGANSCRNFAFSIAKGEYIQWFDSDDILLPQGLEFKVQFLEKNPEVSFVVSKAKVVYDASYKGRRGFKQNFTYENLIKDYLQFKILFITGGPLFRREVFNSIGLFNQNLKKHQEWDLFFRAILAFPNWGILENETFEYRINGQSISASLTQKLDLLDAEVKAIRSVYSPEINPYSYKIPYSITSKIILRYLLVTMKYGRFLDAKWCARILLKSAFQSSSP